MPILPYSLLTLERYNEPKEIGREKRTQRERGTGPYTQLTNIRTETQIFSFIFLPAMLSKWLKNGQKMVIVLHMVWLTGS